MTSTIKVNNVQNQCGQNIINENSNTITIGASGDTIALASGASQTGFGRTGTVDWQTSIKTATFTAVNGEGYFCNTSGGAFTVNLPSSPSVGDIVAIKDYGSSFATNNLTIGRGGSNMNGSASDSVRSTNNESLTLVYADASKGWLSVEEGTGFVGENYITATGGSITTSGNCKIHTFTGPGTFTVCSVATTAANNVVSYMVVAGGGGGGSYAGGGGAGGFREVKSPVTPYTASPLDGYPSAPNRVTVTATSFPITVGGGGAKGSPSTGSPAGSRADNGSNSVFSTITSAGGGGSGQGEQTNNAGASGGSGGGGAPASGSGGASGGSGNTPPVTPPQGNNGGSAYHNPGCFQLGGGGGGATAAGGNGPSTPIPGGAVGAGPGGTGATTSINATPTAYAGGGGGYGDSLPGGTGGTGGGGAGGGPSGTAGTANTGGGGGGGNPSPGAGGSGIVIIRYKFQ